MVVGLYGGSFDPPHDGHRHVARKAMKKIGLDRIWWLVSPGNPFKPEPSAPISKRLTLARSLMQEPRMIVTDFETTLSQNRTYDVVRHLQKSHPSVRFVWIMGADSFMGIHRWYKWQQLVKSVPLCVVSRRSALRKAQNSHAAVYLRRYFIADTRAKSLPFSTPGWTYLASKLHAQSSSQLRQNKTYKSLNYGL